MDCWIASKYYVKKYYDLLTIKILFVIYLFIIFLLSIQDYLTNYISVLGFLILIIFNIYQDFLNIWMWTSFLLLIPFVIYKKIAFADIAIFATSFVWCKTYENAIFYIIFCGIIGIIFHLIFKRELIPFVPVIMISSILQNILI